MSTSGIVYNLEQGRDLQGSEQSNTDGNLKINVEIKSKYTSISKTVFTKVLPVTRNCNIFCIYSPPPLCSNYIKFFSSLITCLNSTKSGDTYIFRVDRKVSLKISVAMTTITWLINLTKVVRKLIWIYW